MRARKMDKLASASHLRSKHQERELATRFGGHITAGSGNKVIKGDVQIQHIARIEAKCTQHKSFSVTRDMVNKITQASLGAGEVPIIHIEFLTGSHVDSEIALVPVWALRDLLGITP